MKNKKFSAYVKLTPKKMPRTKKKADIIPAFGAFASSALAGAYIMLIDEKYPCDKDINANMKMN